MRWRAPTKWISSPQGQWNIGIVYEPIQSFLDSRKKVIHWFPMPEKHKFYADPFGVKIKDDIYIFVEEYSYKEMKGKISYAKLSDNVSKIKFKTILEQPFHISYPYIFTHNEFVYCIPETSHANEISLYKFVNLPKKMEKVATLIKNVKGKDPTITQYKGRWYLFFTYAPKETSGNANLCIWHSKKLLGPWKLHKNNPVKKDVRSARPAGTPFIHGGQLYRPAQDCSKNYGNKIVINKVTELTPKLFKEEIIAIINPEKNSVFPEGRHTMSSVGNFTLIDGSRYVRNIYSLKNRTSSFRKLIGRFLSRARRVESV